MDCAQIFNPFHIFDRTVERRFTIRARDYSKYTVEQLREHIPCKLRTFAIDDQIWYLAKDICSFLGITPNHVSQTLENIENAYIRKETINFEHVASFRTADSHVTQGHLVTLLNESGVFAVLQKSKTTYAQDFKSWLNEEVLPSIAKHGAYITDVKIKELQKDPNQLKNLIDDLELHKQEVLKRNAEIKQLNQVCKRGYVYVASSEEYMKNNVYKIGSTAELEHRLVQLNTSRDIDDSLVILKSYYIPYYKRAEKMIHHLFKEFRNSEKREFFTIHYTKLIDELDVFFMED